MKIKLKTKNTILTNDNGVYDVYVIPTKQYNIDKIPAGPNPRDLDDTAPVIKKIRSSYEKGDGNFIIRNGGMQVIIDNDSLNYDNDYVTFSCSDSLLTGHYDGQHSQYAIAKAVNESKQQIDNSVKITLIEKRCFKNLLDIRGAASSWNTRTKQKLSSESNILGHFDALKRNISKQYVSNIGFKQNQKNKNNEKIKPENEVQQVLRILSTLLPLTYENGMDVNAVASFAKGAENMAIKLVKDDCYAPYMEQTYCHVNYFLELSDYIQTSMKQILKDDFNEFAILKQTAKSQLEKTISKRLSYKQGLFSGGTAVGCLDKDWLPIFIHSLVNNCFEYDGANNKFIMIYNLEETKAIWQECGYDVLKLIENEFNVHFTSIFKSRRADFANQPAKWNQISNIVSKTIRKGLWRHRVETKLKNAS